MYRNHNCSGWITFVFKTVARLGRLLTKYLSSKSDKFQQLDTKMNFNDKVYYCLQFAGLIGSIKAALPPEERLETINPSEAPISTFPRAVSEPINLQPPPEITI